MSGTSGRGNCDFQNGFTPGTAQGAHYVAFDANMQTGQYFSNQGMQRSQSTGAYQQRHASFPQLHTGLHNQYQNSGSYVNEPMSAFPSYQRSHPNLSPEYGFHQAYSSGARHNQDEDFLQDIQPNSHDFSLNNINEFTTSRDDQPWQPLTGGRQVGQSPSLQVPFYASGNVRIGGAMSDPTPRQAEDAYSVISPQSGVSEDDSGCFAHPRIHGRAEQQQFNCNPEELMQDVQSSDRVEHQGTDDAPPKDRPKTVKRKPNLTIPKRPRSVSTSLPPCLECRRQPKNQSDQRKHLLQHTRPHTCDHAGCKRVKGFPTLNDLERHRKAVHHAIPSVGSKAGYICVCCPPTSEPKWWPRMDNFKAHVKRKHSKEDVAMVLNASKTLVKPDDARTVVTDSAIGESATGRSQSIADDSAYQYPQHDFLSPTSAFSLSRHASQHGESLLAHAGGGANSSEELRANYFATIVEPRDSTLPSISVSSAPPSRLQLDVTLSVPSPADFGNRKRRRVSQDPGSANITQDDYTSFIAQQRSPVRSSRSDSSIAISRASNGDLCCPHCPKKKKRECDLKKHMKRHTRPYGCTFPRCFKRFGSRNDWKRHENTQHYIHEMWRCPSCGKVCHQEEHFQKHLTKCMNILDVAGIADLCSKFKLGNDSHYRFWCGFCEEVIEQDDDVSEPWKNRLQHIGDHFDKKERTIDDWICVESRQKKAYLKDNRASTSSLPCVDSSETDSLPDDGIPNDSLPKEEETPRFDEDIDMFGFGEPVFN